MYENYTIDNLHIVTVATHSKHYLPYLIESCSKYGGVKLDILGFGEKWQGYNWKFIKTLEYLRRLPPDDIACFVDGYDVICTRDLHELLPVFTKLKRENNCKIIIACDIQPFYTYVASYFVFGKCKSYFINSGTYIGIVSDLIEVLENIYKLYPHTNNDDQIAMCKYCSMNPDIFYIDTKNELFLAIIHGFNTDMSTYVDFKEENIVYNGSRPFFYHANGNGVLDNVIKKLGMHLYHNKIKEEMRISSYKKIKYYVLLILDTYKYSIAFIIIVVIIIISMYMFNKSSTSTLKSTSLSLLSKVKDIKIGKTTENSIARIKDRIKGIKLKI